MRVRAQIRTDDAERRRRINSEMGGLFFLCARDDLQTAPECVAASECARLRFTMSHQESELLASVLRLPQPVHAKFAHEIRASLDESAEMDSQELWRAEIERRTEEVLAGTADLEDADVVHEQLTARLRVMSR